MEIAFVCILVALVIAAVEFALRRSLLALAFAFQCAGFCVWIVEQFYLGG